MTVLENSTRKPMGAKIFTGRGSNTKNPNATQAHSSSNA